MRIHSKIALLVLSLAIGLPVAYAQMPGPGPAPQQSSSNGPGRMMGGHGWASQRRAGGPGCRGGRMGMNRRGRRGSGMMLMRLVNNPEMRKRLGITAQQAESIGQKTSEFMKGQIRNRANLRIQRLDLRNLLAAENPDRAAINSALEQISTLQLARAKAAVNFRLDMRNALTPEQRQKLMQMRREFMRRGPGRQGMPGRRGPQRMKSQGSSGSGSN
jgi:Spy/CpxP family protein refolding chaperone